MRHPLAVALVLALPAWHGSAVAQDAPPANGAIATPVNPAVTGGIDADDPESIIEAIREGKTNIGALQSLSSVGKVEVVRVGEAAPDSSEALEAAVAESRADIAMLQQVIEANPALKAELDAQSVPVAEVIAAKVE